MKSLLIFLLTLSTVAHSQVKFNVPEIEVPVSTYINLPVVIETNSNDVGSLEFALNYDPTYLAFEEISVTAKAQQWLTYTMDWQGETVRWGGYDASFGNYTISSPTELFTVRFKVIDQSWVEIPITIGRKTAGTELGWDIEVISTDGYVNKREVSFDVPPTDGISGIAYPIPTTGLITLELTVPENGDYKVIIYDFFGKQQGIYSKKFFSGYVSFRVDVRDLATGIYLLQVTNGRFVKTFKIIKNG